MTGKPLAIVGDRHAAALVLYRAKWPDKRLGSALGVCTATVFYWRTRHDLPALVGTKGRQIDHAAALALHADGATDGEIARRQGVTQSGVTRWRHRHGLPANAERTAALQPEVKAAVVKLLLCRMSVPEIAKALGVARNTIRRTRDTLGDDSRLLRNGERPASAKRLGYASGARYRNLAADRRRAAFLAYCEGLSDPEVAERIGSKPARVCEWRARYGLPPNRVERKPRPAARPAGPAITPLSNDLYRRAAAAVGYGVAPDLAGDAISDIVVAVLSGELAAERIEAEAHRFVNAVVRSFASKFGPRSLDEEIGEDGFCLRDVIPDTSTDFAFDLALYRGLEARRAAA